MALLGCASAGQSGRFPDTEGPFPQAYRAFLARDYDTAAARFDECLGTDSTRVEYEAFFFRAVCLHQLGDTEAGRAFLDQGIARVRADSAHFLADAASELQEWSAHYPRIPKVLLPRGGFKLEDLAPDFIRRVQPEYPASANWAGREGQVLVRALVDRRGVPTRCEIRQSAGEALDQAALRALGSSRFTPGKHHGRRARLWVLVPYTFRLR